MASDDAYAAFLEQANRDPNSGGTHAAATRPNRELKSVDEGEEVPRVLGEVTRGKFYVSDADEGFVPVCLRWGESDLPDEGSYLSFFLPSSPIHSAPLFFLLPGDYLDGADVPCSIHGLFSH